MSDSAASKFGESNAGPGEASPIRQPDSPIQPSAATVDPRFVLGLGPPLGQIEEAYAMVLAKIAMNDADAKHELCDCAKDVLALAGEIRRLDAALGPAPPSSCRASRSGGFFRRTFA